jgi:hypothetical protein
MGGERMRLEAMAVTIPQVDGHPNRVPFEGVLTMVNTASDKAPAGARGHRVMLMREAAEKALPSLLGMGVDYRPGWDGHDGGARSGY